MTAEHTEHTDAAEYVVVVNDEEQYAVWDTGLPVPGGWRRAGFSGRRAECLEHIEAVWTDMRPLSLRTAGR
ncbi:MbtH family NRPS accessory protein [Streptomyces actinomycinicus]|uniref:MbtH family NRPS accessory protein n=1 Tax=Streptomyces actinomycinicus TaxID=1695166 RepID=A0A937EIG5_9ACTN|nr:MbtH family NRPS accessory protein [Streptomyces actinomycinicus]MBL1082685.1 MbtH family NRPS accessory protein [Streptomyces actinomycinicus]